jgi:hypothetical protein
VGCVLLFRMHTGLFSHLAVASLAVSLWFPITCLAPTPSCSGTSAGTPRGQDEDPFNSKNPTGEKPFPGAAGERRHIYAHALQPCVCCISLLSQRRWRITCLSFSRARALAAYVRPRGVGATPHAPVSTVPHMVRVSASSLLLVVPLSEGKGYRATSLSLCRCVQDKRSVQQSVHGRRRTADLSR